MDCISQGVKKREENQLHFRVYSTENVKALRERWRSPKKYGASVESEDLMKKILKIVASGKWKEELQAYFEKVSLPFAHEDCEELFIDLKNNKVTKINVDLRGIKLPGLNFSQLAKDFSGIHFDYSDLSNSDFSGCDISGSYFIGTDLTGTVLRNVKADNSFFILAKAANANFEEADLKGSLFQLAVLLGSDFRKANLEGTDFLYSLLSHSRFDGTTIDHKSQFVNKNAYVYKDKHKCFYIPTGFRAIAEVLEDNNSKSRTRKINGFVRVNSKIGNPEFIWDYSNHVVMYRKKTVRNFAVLRDETEYHKQKDMYAGIMEVYRQIKLLLRTFGNYMEADSYLFLELSAKRKALRNHLFSAILWLVEKSTGYGIRMGRLFLLALTTILSFAGIYFLAFQNVIPFSAHMNTMERIGRSIYFSAVTFSTLGYGDLSPVGYLRYIANLEAFLGLVITGIFIVSVARKLMSS